MKAHLTRRYMFSASHRLHSEAHVRRRERGYLWQVQQPAWTRAQLLGRSHSQRRRWMKPPEWSATWSIWTASCSAKSCERFDLENLNMQPEFAEAVPTTENLCTAIYDILQRGFLTHIWKRYESKRP